ncbi:MAG: glycosyltransferase family 4 protein [Candidatus Latescibacterota bacterium]
MKIVHIVPGSGGSFYCQNCMRDSELVRSLNSLGHETAMIPLYLPFVGIPRDIPVFYGAINLYLRERFPIYRHAPAWLVKLFDSRMLLGYAAQKAGSTRAAGLEEMTVSMLRGEEGRQAGELDHLVRFLQEEVKPDIVHLSNALLLGLARRLKNELGAKIVCSLQDENEWTDPMSGEYREKVWSLMAERAADVDMFVAPSRYYAEKTRNQMNIPSEKMRVICGGIALEGYQQSPLLFNPPVIGYLCRMSEYFGLGIMVDAFIRLKRDERFQDLRLHLTGGRSGDDQKFIGKMLRNISRRGFGKDVRIYGHFDKANRIEFMKSLTLLSVPAPAGEAFGAYQAEALAAGVPVVQPDAGGFPEFIEATGGGVIYRPNDGETLAKTMAALLAEPNRVRELGARGRKAVFEKYSINTLAENMVDLYRNILNISETR